MLLCEQVAIVLWSLEVSASIIANVKEMLPTQEYSKNVKHGVPLWFTVGRIPFEIRK